MELTIKNLLLIDGAGINDKKTYSEITHITVHKDIFCNIEYVYNSELNDWRSYVWTWDYDTGFYKIKIHTFTTIEEIVKQIYYITGYGHGILDKK